MPAPSPRTTPRRSGWPHDLRVEIVPGDGTTGELEDGDALLVCSDGVHDALGEADLMETARTPGDPAAAVEQLVALALARGSLDNASVALARADPLPQGAEPGLTDPKGTPKLASGAIV